MARRFDGLVAWITGGGTGIGRALCVELGRRGATVAASGRRHDRLAETVDEVAANGGRGLAVVCDVTKEEEVRAAVDGIVAQLGRLDVAVANAGYGIAAPFEKIDGAMWLKQMETNVVGTALTLRHALPHLRKTRGRAAVISSVMGKFAVAGSAAYCASKFALVGMCDALYQELHGSGVSITNVLPGLVSSDIAKVDNEGNFRPEWEDRRPQALLWPADRAARVVADAIHARRREFTFTAHGKAAAFIGQHLPGVVYPLMARMGVRGRG